MINIIEAGKKIKKERMAKFYADMQVYTIRNEIVYVFENLYAVGHAFIGIFAKLFKKPWKKYNPLSWEERYDNAMQGARFLTEKDCFDGTLDILKKCIHVPKKYRDNDDMSASYLVNYAVKGKAKKELAGYSILEKVEYIYEKYPHMKEKNEKKTLLLWFLFSILILVAFLFAPALVTVNLFVSIVLGIGMILLLTLYVHRKMCMRWAMYYVWLARTEYGRKLSDANLLLDNMQETQLFERKEDLQLLHSYLWILENEKEKQKQLKDVQNNIENRIEKNNKRIEELQQRGDSDADRMRMNLEEENFALGEEVRGVEGQEKIIDSRITQMNEKMLEESDNNVEFYTELWRKYLRIDIDRDTYVKLLCNLDFADLKKLENRLYELNHVKDPLALAEQKAGKYYVSFRTEQGDIAKIYFEYQIDNNKINIVEMEREEKLKIVPLTAEGIQRVIERRGKSGDAENAEILQYIRRIEALDAETEKLREEKYNADVKLQNCVQEICQLNISVEKSTKRCEQLEQELKKISDNEEQTKNLVREYEEKQNELLELTKRVEQKSKELGQWKKRCEELNKQIQENQTVSDRVLADLEARNQVLQDNINALESSLELQKQLAEEAAKKQSTDKQAILKLQNTNLELEKTLKSTRVQLADLKTAKKELLLKRQKEKKQFEKTKEELEIAKKEARQSLAAMKEAQENSSTEKYYATYKKIKTKFPKLSQEATIFFSTAEQFFETFGTNETVDYSPIYLEYCKVLEVSVWSYLRRSKAYANEVKECFQTKHRATLGSATYIILQDTNKPLGKFAQELEEIRKGRNSSAHKGTQGYKQAEALKNYLWNTDILIKITEKENVKS